MYILGGLEDSVPLYIWSLVRPEILTGIYENIFFVLLHPLSSNQPILWSFISIFLKFFDYNWFLVITLILNLLFSYRLFKKYKFGVVYTLIFSFSSYAWIHAGVHPALSQIWPIPMFLSVLFKYDSRFYNMKERFIIALTLLVSILVSNYIGFFLLILFGLYALIDIRAIKEYLIIFGIVLLGTFVFLWPYMQVNYLGAQIPSEERMLINRPYDDFFTFSGRPWYFVIPPVKNPFFGEISKEIIATIESTNYFLADDYFATEHSSSYFGLLLLLFTIIASVYTYKNSEARKKQILGFWVILLALFILIFPPFFTISGIEIYTPGWLFHKFFPMFRVTARLSIAMLIILLLVLAESIDFIHSKLESRRVLTLLMALLLFVTLAETYVPLKFVKFTTPPEVYSHIEGKFAVYPYDGAREALLWLPVHEKEILNPRDYIVGDFDAEEFTERLQTAEGIQEFREQGGEYLVVRKDSDFENFQNLELVGEYGEHLLYSIF